MMGTGADGEGTPGAGGRLPGLVALCVVVLAVAVAAAGGGGAVTVGEGGFRVETIPAEIGGTWQLFPGPNRPQATAEGGTLVRVPGAWENSLGADYDGFAWYRVRFFLPEGLGGLEPLGIWLPPIRDADRTLLNGETIGATGGFPPRFEKATLYPRVYPLPQEQLVRGGWNTLEIQVYNHARRGGLVGKPPVIGTYRSMMARLHGESTVVVVFSVFFLLVALNHGFLFLHRTADETNGVFALYGVSSALYLLTFSPVVLPRYFALNAVFRMNLVLMPLTAALLTVFLYKFFSEPVPGPVRWLAGLLAVDALWVLLWPRLDDLYLAVQAAEFVILGLMAALASFLVGQVRRRAPYGWPVTVVVAAMFAAAGYDILADLGLFPAPRWSVAGMLFPFAFIPFYAVLGMILGHRYAGYYRESTVDELTGLLRRKAFFSRVEEEMQRARRDRRILVFGVLDLDGFKRVNDVAGHAAGDRVLRSVGALIQEHLRPFDLAGRLGGDEIAVALSVAHRIDGKTILDRICRAIAAIEVPSDHGPLRVTVSCGAVMWEPSQGEVPSALDLIRAADRSMYVVKQKGGGSVALDRIGVTLSGRVPAVEEQR